MTPRTSTSLVSLYRKLSINWATAGFILTIFISLGCFFVLSKQSAETKIKTLTESVARAFRPAILDGNIRDAQFQMARVLDLTGSEHVVIRNSDLKLIYALDREETPSTCKAPKKVCWENHFSEMTYLQPIYFNDDLKDELFGYVEVKITNHFNWALAGIFSFFLTLLFSVGAWTLFRAQKRSVGQITRTVNAWAARLRKTPGLEVNIDKAPYTELSSLESSISDLHLEIERLKLIASQDAKSKAQMEMLQEINHDLKTPFSQLAKFFTVHIAKTRRTGKIDDELVEYMTRSMARIGDLIRQVGSVQPVISAAKPSLDVTNIGSEAEILVQDLLQSETFSSQKSALLVSSSPDIFACISKAQFYRVLDNLLRNALDAVDPVRGKVSVTVKETDGSPTLIVEDNGSGIPDGDLKTIFECGFTTKPSRGSGLGLSILKKICDECLAKIDVRSSVGVGTTFTIEFLRPPTLQYFSEIPPSKEVTV